MNTQFGKTLRCFLVYWYAGSYADLKFTQRCWTLVALSAFTQFGEYIGGLIEVKGKALPAVGLLHRPA